MQNFIVNYVKSMRLYYSFVTGIAGWLGVACYEFQNNNLTTQSILSLPMKKVLILALLFLSWGVNQIINDFLGLNEDRINAPQRPMVTGELNQKPALILSGILILLSFLLTWFFLEPFANLFLIGGILLNVIYEEAKKRGIWGNLVFGIMISMATLYGYYANNSQPFEEVNYLFMLIILLVIIINGVMTYFTYFKDYAGDKKTSAETLVVKYGPKKSGTIGLFAAILPAIAMIAIYFFYHKQLLLNETFILLFFITIGIQLVTGFLYFKYPIGEKTYTSLKANFRACVCAEAALIAFFQPDLGLWLFLFSYILIGFLFSMHKNSKA